MERWRNRSASITRKDSRFNPRFGLLYDLTPWLAVYGNYVTSFGANNGVSPTTNQPFPPQTAEQQEVGLKGDLFDHRLMPPWRFII